MKKFIITWNAGYGESAEIIEAETQQEAEELAYQAWREEAENQSDYQAIEFTEELADNYGLSDE